VRGKDTRWIYSSRSILSVPFSGLKAKTRRLFNKGNDPKQENVKMTPPRRPPVLQPKTMPQATRGNAINKDGTIMLFTTNPNGSQFILCTKHPNELRSFTEVLANTLRVAG
jgi:hypothetical protein